MRVRHCGDESEHAEHEWELVLGGFRHGGTVERCQCVGTTAGGAEIARRSRFSRGRIDLAPMPIVWGLTLCKRLRCVEAAVCSIDGEPYCLDHADEEIERAGVPPEFARSLPPLDE